MIPRVRYRASPLHRSTVPPFQRNEGVPFLVTRL